MKIPDSERPHGARSLCGRLFRCLSAALSLAPLALLAQPQATPDDEVVELETYTVLGSSITRFDQESTLPVTTLDIDSISTEGFVSPGEIFTEMVFTGSPEFTETSDGPNDARGDVTSINLRGAGPGQTLVLLNGRRLASHPLNQTVGQAPSVLVNANVIPAGLIDRVDILRDGASAIYGTDASAGVVNTQLERHVDGQELRVRFGYEEGGDFEEKLFTYTGGLKLNEGKTDLVYFLSYYHRDPIFATSRDYAVNGDKRPLVDEKWRDDVSIINDSSGGVYANLETDLPASRDRLRQNGVSITDSTGRFHINAPGFSGGTATLANGLEIDDGTLPREPDYERYNFSPFRTLTSEVDRTNAFAIINHRLNKQLSFFFEFGYYASETYQERAAVVIGTSDALVIPARNYWNPFGPTTFADGRANPNRLSGITLENGDPLPAEGIDIQLDGWRAEDLGLRLVTVETDSYLFTAGYKGRALEDWYWESAVRYNRNEATDTSDNRLSKTGIIVALDNDTPKALNVFGGPGVNNPNDFPDLLLQVSRTAETELLTYDLRINNPGVTNLFGNPVGIAFGFEARYESWADDRDPLIDGSMPFDDTFQGRSNVIGVSPTQDESSDRTVFGFYGELLIPLVGESNDIPLVHRFEVQLAGRWEDYNDFGDILKPKVGVAWYLTPDLFVRGSYAEGFTAPNLSILTAPIQRFNTGIQDTYRLQWDPGNGQNDGSEQLADVRSNSGLGPEESTTWTVGGVLRVPFVEGLTLTVDYFNIEIIDRIGTIGQQEIIGDDADILETLSANPGNYSPGQVVIGDPRVERGPISQEHIDLATSQGFAPAGPILRVQNPYVNEASREIDGVDFGFEYVLPNRTFGRFKLSGNASFLGSFRDVEVQGGGVTDALKDEINPRLRAQMSLSWRKGPWSAGATTNYISSTIDNDVDATDGEEWVLDEYWRTSIRGGYAFENGPLEGFRVTLGVRNLFDVEPSLHPDESIGYEAGLHSNRRRLYYTDLRYEF